MSWWERRVVPRLVELTCRGPEVDRFRAPVCAGLHGDVLEIGFGSGLNVAHYPPSVRRVGAIEPNELAWRLAADRVEGSAVPVERIGLDAQRVDAEDATYDNALVTFTLCTIPDVAAALAEVRRLLRPGGTLHFAEHGLAPDPGVARWQRRLTPVQRRLAGGCHLDRPVVATLERAGFRVDDVVEGYAPIGPRVFGYVSHGRASTP
jgi:SAM-dependent methyltransferase